MKYLKSALIVSAAAIGTVGAASTNSLESEIVSEVLEFNENANSCEVVDRSGSMDIWTCRDEPGKYICYVTVECDDGQRFTNISKWCTGSFSDCW